MSDELVRFQDTGPPPIVFTIGSSGVLDARLFFERSAGAAKLLDRGQYKSSARTQRTGPHPSRPASSRAITFHSRSFFHEPPRSSTRATSARRVWRCIPVVRCWLCPVPRPVRQRRAGDPTRDWPHDFATSV